MRSFSIRSNTLCFLIAAVSAAQAAGPPGIRTDGTLGGPATTLSGPLYSIGQNLGVLSGGNLFFSFQYFNVAAQQTALFTTTSPGISNIISRVTGGFASDIEGTLAVRAASGSPDFFFINPSGVIFGPTSTVDVPGAFHVSTADYLKFSDGNYFYADTVHSSSLSMAAPEAFGFLGSNRASVQMLGTYLSPGGNGQVDVAAGDVVVDGQGTGAGIVGQDGKLNLTAVGNSRVEVPLDGSVSVDDGTITIRNGGLVATESDGSAAGGAVTLTAGTVLIDGAGYSGPTGVATLTGSAQNAGAVLINAGGDVTIQNGASVTSISQGAGAAGAIGISAGGTASVINADVGFPLSASSGTSGSVAVTAGNILIDGEGTGNSFVFTLDGNIGLTAQNGGAITISNGGLVGTQSDGLKPGGAVMLNGGTVTIDGTGFAGSTGVVTSTYSNQNAGVITIGASGNVSLMGAELGTITYGSGPAGDVAITAGGIASLTDGAIVSVRGTGATGAIGITATDILVDDAQMLAQRGDIVLTALGTAAPSAAASAANGALTIRDGSLIQTLSDDSAPGGAISLTAGTVTVDGTGVSTAVQTYTSTAQNAGAITINAHSGVTVNDGALISSTTAGMGTAGTVSITTPNLSLAGQGFSGDGTNAVGIQAETEGPGNGGDVIINVNTLSLQQGTGTSGVFISTQADPGSKGSGGEILINARDSVSVTDGALITAGTEGGGNGGRIEITTNNLQIAGPPNYPTNTEITTDSVGSGTGNAGDIQLNVGSLTIQGSAASPNVTVGIVSEARQGSQGGGGRVTVTASGAVTLEEGGEIVTDTNSGKPAGQIAVTAGSVSILGQSFDSTDHGTEISSSTLAAGNAGEVIVRTGTLTIAGSTGSRTFSGLETFTQGAGAGGTVTATVSGTTLVSEGGEIRSNSYGAGNAGSVNLTTGALVINAEGHSQGETAIAADAFASGNGGAVNIWAQSLAITGVAGANLAVGIESVAEVGSSGAGGEVNVHVQGNAVLTAEGEIASDADPGTSGRAGRVSVTVGNTLSLSNDADISSGTLGTGNAGDVTVNAGKISIVGGANTSGTVIDASSESAGNAGNVYVTAGSISINGAGGVAGIASEVGSPQGIPAGAAGQVSVDVSGNLTLSDGGLITSTSAGLGPAGSTSITAGNISITGGTYPSGIASQSIYSGQPGPIIVHTGNLQMNDSYIDISNFATVRDPANIQHTAISVFASSITLDNAQISAGSSGNVAASDVDVHVTGPLTLLGNSQLYTDATDGNGGAINVASNGLLTLNQSQITTSVTGNNGNGGNITIQAPYVLLETGAIQANTVAPRASGGEISIDALAVLPTFQSYILGGPLVTVAPDLLGQNVVQAAAPNGVSGTLNATTPTLDIGNSLLRLTAPVAGQPALGRSPCGNPAGSSLALVGQGGLPPAPSGPLWIDGDDADAKQSALEPGASGGRGEASGAHGAYSSVRVECQVGK
jgi:filamentous hemagglutinin family protein